MNLLTRLNKEYGKTTIVVVTHDPHCAKCARTIRYLEKCKLLPEGRAPEGLFVGDAGCGVSKTKQNRDLFRLD